MSKLSRHDIQKLEDYWINLEDYKRQLRHRERDLIEGWCETDTNIGGGKSNRISDTTGNRATILADDVMLQNLKRIVHTICIKNWTMTKKQLSICVIETSWEITSGNILQMNYSCLNGKYYVNGMH